MVLLCVCLRAQPTFAPLLALTYFPRADSRGATCCAEIRTILDCDPVGDCLGYTGDCGDLQTQFADLQGPFVYSDGPGDPPTEHDSLADYVCHAFPDDAYVTDQFFVGLISVAVALPVDMILVRMFEASNEGDAPEQWLEAPSGNWKLLLGKDCHHAWNYDAKDKPVSDLVKWVARRGGEDTFAIIMRLLAWLWAKLKGPAAEDRKTEDDDKESDDAESFDSAEARSDACSKRGYAFGGLLGVYVVWTVFAWVIFTYGMLIYKQLGDSAQKEFAKVCHPDVCGTFRFAASNARARSGTDLGRWLLAEQRLGVAGGFLDCRKDSAHPGHPGHLACDQRRAVVRGARRLHQHAGHAVQRRGTRLVEPDAAAGGAAEPPCRRLRTHSALM